MFATALRLYVSPCVKIPIVLKLLGKCKEILYFLSYLFLQMIIILRNRGNLKNRDAMSQIKQNCQLLLTKHLHSSYDFVQLLGNGNGQSEILKHVWPRSYSCCHLKR